MIRLFRRKRTVADTLRPDPEYRKRREAGKKAAEARGQFDPAKRLSRLYADPIVRGALAAKPVQLFSHEKRKIKDHLRWRDGDNCHYCNTPLNFEDHNKPNYATIEHLRAQALGGDHSPQNLALSCFACNQGKSVDAKAVIEKLRRVEARYLDATEGLRRG